MGRATILVVEDEPIIARNIQNRLKSLQYTVPVIVDTGEEAMEQTANLHPDVILMDIHLRGAMDGVEAAQQIRLSYDVPVIYLTAYADDNTLERAKVTEPFGYVLKPFDLRELQIAIEIAIYKHQMERKLRLSQRWLATMLRSIGEGIIAVDLNGQIQFMNPIATQLTGWRQDEALGQPLERVLHLVHDNSDTMLSPQRFDLAAITSPQAPQLLMTKDGTTRPIEISIAAIRDDCDIMIGMIVSFRDISERRRLEAEREQLIGELQNALAKVKTLRSLIPMCASCKRIRDDAGYWTQIEIYLHDHAATDISHGLCPECARRLYPDFSPPE